LHHFFILAADAAAAPTGAGGDQPNPLFQMLITFAPLMIIFWLFFIRPESKRRKEKEQLLGGVKAKDRVVTIGGLYGTVVDVEGDEIVLLVDPKKDVKLRFRRSAIDTVNPTDDKEKK
jgi:preprotein translocase subunit YajC